MAQTLSVSECISLACLLEAIAPKPGNVHRGADFEQLEFADFAVAATVMAPGLAQASTAGVGVAVHEAVSQMRSWVGRNTSLGTVLLLAPLAAVPPGEELRSGVGRVLNSLSAVDAHWVYEAIRLAQPGGLGRVDAMDVRDAPPDSLLDAMRAAADYDLVARQYANGFSDVLDVAVPTLEALSRRGWPLLVSVVQLQLTLLERYPDSLIQRKCGLETAEQASALAGIVLEAGEPDSIPYNEALADFDFWLRSDGNRRNPGTTADLVAATLYAALRDQRIRPPFR